jgi:hypothetical protein
MSAQSAEREKRSPATAVQKYFPITRTVPGFEGTRLLIAFSGDTYSVPLYMAGATVSVSANAASGVSVGGTFYSGIDDYDPDFVASLLAADAVEPEASFNNVVDLLDWLDRD